MDRPPEGDKGNKGPLKRADDVLLGCARPFLWFYAILFTIAIVAVISAIIGQWLEHLLGQETAAIVITWAWGALIVIVVLAGVRWLIMRWQRHG